MSALPTSRQSWPRMADFSAASLTAGFVAVLVGYTSSVAIIFQAANALGASQAQIVSWMWALGWGMGLASIIPSLYYKRPVLCAWSTPGAALLASSAHIGLAEAVGGFVICGVLILIAGASGWFEKLVSRVPKALAGALLAGVLARFGMDAFRALSLDLTLVLLMCASYLLGKRFWPRYAVIGVLLTGMAAASAAGSLHWELLRFELAMPVFVTPRFTWAAVFSVALPLFVVTMASQNLPGVAAIRQAGYDTPISMPIAVSGGLTVLLAPFGGFALNLAAISAAICMSPDAHPEPAKRYTAVLSAGFWYCLVGSFGAIVVSLLLAFPRPLILALAGLALLGTIGNALAQAVSEPSEREAALITFLVTLSGVTLGGIGSAFWGVVAGCIAVAWLKRVP